MKHLCITIYFNFKKSFNCDIIQGYTTFGSVGGGHIWKFWSTFCFGEKTIEVVITLSKNKVYLL